MVNSHWYQQTHTFDIQRSKYSILDVYSPLSKHNVFCSNGSESPALTAVSKKVFKTSIIISVAL